jgi:Na+/H+ antiporter NhaD/arsenite permease-like protein
MPIPIIVMLIVFIAIAIRQFGRFKIQIWQIMLTGALTVLATRQISLNEASRAINYDVMLFLLGMFILGRALEDSGYLAELSNRVFGNSKSVNALILLIIFGAGTVSALLMNDTVAIIGTPIMLHLARRHKLNPQLLLLALAFAITLGSVISPIGNPQNLLIALNGGFNNPFATFFFYLLIPTVLNMFLTWLILRLYFRKEFAQLENSHENKTVRDIHLARLSRYSFALMIVMILSKIVFSLSGSQLDFKLTYIAIVAALPIVLFNPRRIDIIKHIDWSTLVFFAAMFVLMDSVWHSGVFQMIMAKQLFNLNSNIGILIFSVAASQFISNVPLVALYLPALIQNHGSVIQFMALASGSTIAGNFLILGAASNIIIIQNAENRSAHTISFFDFAKIGIPLTIINILIYWASFEFISFF